MISTREQVVTRLAVLSEAQLRQVAEYLEFLEFRARRQVDPSLDEADLAALYGEFADEDRALAEVGLAEYVANLEREDAAQ
jgi:DNA-binding GntR family transcriptional regulator